MDYKKKSNITVLIFGLLLIILFFKSNTDLSITILFGNFWLKSFTEINSNKKRYLVIDFITIMWLIYLSLADITVLVSLIIIIGTTIKDIMDYTKGSRNISITTKRKKKKQEYYFGLLFFLILGVVNIISFFKNEEILFQLLNIVITIISIVVIIVGIKNKKYFDN
ncbi:hypothetical protein [Lactococcus petauri]|uniref:hypothetical protein n=1 Tax=Lactococcus petauri TaxID=1940789 RepID=UPI001F591A77|nr:hypothetical protein [Lactococcus petauri]